MEKGLTISKKEITTFLTRQANAEKNQKTNFTNTASRKVDINAASSSTKTEEKTAKSSEDDLYPDCPATTRG